MALAFFVCAELVLSTNVMARLKAVISPDVIPETKSSTEGCFWRLAFIVLAESGLKDSGGEIPSCSFKADLYGWFFLATLDVLWSF